MPLEYTANKNAWMMGTIFTKWLIALDKRLSRDSRKIALIVDNCPAHLDVSDLKCRKRVFLPPNTTSATLVLLQKYIAMIDSKQDAHPPNALDRLHLLHVAWERSQQK
ncbi:Tigger transposable element-derived protein 4 [Trichinella papuae]|uniref:Tigger transposable element-derived protein 4 n=1 Tax=Trichinella papuae TaxID=268474 RepID=A0A0V1MKX3_9BILA|nr:Tigger transposable element-derived protein 4 [Trichinella papuae]KRZ72464.1 Tigger transposable element-derived protein 4 [Trichinella papuae]